MVDQNVAQSQQQPDDSSLKLAQQAVKKERVQERKDKAKRIRECAPLSVF